MSYPGLGYVLDNTPYWLQDTRRSSGNGLGRCDPFGYESGDVRVMGGLRDVRHEQHLWHCENQADARYRMTCTNGHSGTVVLCYAHVYQITRRMSQACPRCISPPRARELEETMNRIMADLVRERDPGRRRGMLQRIEDGRREMTELFERGIIRTGAPLRLEEIS